MSNEWHPDRGGGNLEKIDEPTLDADELDRIESVMCHIRPRGTYPYIDLSMFKPDRHPTPPTLEQRLLRAAIKGAGSDVEVMQLALDRLDKLGKPTGKAGVREHDTRHYLLRAELVLSVYAEAGSGPIEAQVADLATANGIEGEWWAKWRAKILRPLRDESRRTRQVATFADGGRFSLSKPVPPSAWRERIEHLKRYGRKVIIRKSGKVPYFRD